MTKEEFAKSIKVKYPQYQSINDTELADKILVKYPQYMTKITDTATNQPMVNTSENGGLGGSVKSLVSVPLTMLARPIQAVAELTGASSQSVDEATKKLTGGLVAPVPQNFSDVKKDVGRGMQTAAFGASGLGIAGAAFGVGSSLEQGNDLFSLQTALQGTLGAAGGKVLGLIGKPIFNVAGKVIGEITPKYLQDIVAKGSQAITDFAAQHEILPAPIKSATEAIGNKISQVGNVTKNAIKTEIKPITDITSNIKGKTQLALSKGNVPENLATSVNRLNTNTKETPLATYNNYVQQESKLKLDSKESDSLGLVGSKELAPAIDNVIQQRKIAGAKMGSEMKAVGNTPVDVSTSFPKFETSLNDSGVTFKNNKVVLSPTSKVTSQDAKILNNYIKDLNTLGANPTAGELDAFLSRVPNELNVYKGQNNIVGTTNAERMIQQNLRDLSGNLTSKANPQFKGYADAKAKYAELSKFLEDNQSFFGKKTASGDYSKDASTLKSAVRSTLNSGKKDFLIQLEKLTGRPILDKTVLALQAMKDSGNAQGESLLNMLMSKDGLNIPTTKAGIIDRAVSGIANKGKKILSGTPIEQTQRYIEDLMNQARSKNLNITKPINTKIKNATIPKTIPKSTPKVKSKK